MNSPHQLHPAKTPATQPRDQPNGAKLREPPASKRLHEPTRTWRPTSPAVMPQTGLHNTPLSAKRASQRARPATDGSRQASQASELLLLLLLPNLAHVLFLRDQSSQSVCQSDALAVVACSIADHTTMCSEAPCYSAQGSHYHVLCLCTS